MTNPSKQEFISLLHAFALGSLNREDYINLIHFLSEEEDYPWQELGEFQNLASLLPSFLDLELPDDELKNRVIQKISMIRGKDPLLVKKTKDELLSHSREHRVNTAEGPRISKESNRKTTGESILEIGRQSGVNSGKKVEERTSFESSTNDESTETSPEDRRKKLAATNIRNRYNKNPREAGKRPQFGFTPQDAEPEQEGYVPSRSSASDEFEEDQINYLGKGNTAERLEHDRASRLTRAENDREDERELYRSKSAPANRRPDSKEINQPTPPIDREETQYQEEQSEPQGEYNPLKAKANRINHARPKYMEEGGLLNSAIGRVEIPSSDEPEDEVGSGEQATAPFPFQTEQPNQPPLPYQPQLVAGIDESNLPFYKKSVQAWVFWIIILIMMSIITLIYFAMAKEIENLHKKIGEKVAVVTADINYFQELKKSGKMNDAVLSMIISSRELKVITLSGKEEYKDAFGKIMIDAKSGHALIQYTNLFTYSPEYGYQLWLKAGQGAIPIGKVFNPSTSFQFYDLEEIGIFKAGEDLEFFVTQESINGSKEPSSKICLSGKFNPIK